MKNGPTQAAQGFLSRNRGTLGGNKHISKAIQNKEAVLLVRPFGIFVVALWARGGLRSFEEYCKIPIGDIKLGKKWTTQFK